MLRPENGYPLRLVVPGIQGVSWTKHVLLVESRHLPYAPTDVPTHYLCRMPDDYDPSEHST